MELWFQKISLAAVLVIAAMTLYGCTRDVSCWTPQSFTPSNARYTIKMCTSNLMERYKLDLYFGKDYKNYKHNASYIWTGIAENKGKWLLKLLVTEISLVCTVYLMVKSLVSGGQFAAKNPKNLHTSYSKAPLYLIIQMGACLCWLIFAMITMAQDNWSSYDGHFMCEFKIARLGTFSTYAVQCMEQGEENIHAALLANFGLGLVIVVTKVLYIVFAFVIQPLTSLKTVANTLAENNVIKNPNQLGPGYSLSDLHFAILVSGGDVKFSGGPQEEELRLMHDK